MKVGISCLYVHLDKPGGLEARIKAVMTALLKRNDSLVVLQTVKAAQGSRSFLSSNQGIESLVLNSRKDSPSFLGERVNHWLVDLPVLLNGKIDILDTWDPYLNLHGRDFALVHSSYYYLEYFFRHLNCHSLGGLRYPLIDSAFLRPPIIYQADAILVENSLQKDYLRAFAPGTQAKCHVVPPGLGSSVLSVLEEGIAMDPWRLLFIGRIEKLKGVDDLLEAFKQCVLRFPQLHLTLVGGGPEMSKYVERTKKIGLTGNVTFTGPLSHKGTMQLLAGSAAMVLPSHLEGFPNTVLEGMRMGVPVIVSDVGSVSRHLVKDGETGVLFKPRDTKGLTQAILRLFEDDQLRQRIASNGKELSKEFTVERVVKDTMATYEKALERYYNHRSRSK